MRLGFSETFSQPLARERRIMEDFARRPGHPGTKARRAQEVWIVHCQKEPDCDILMVSGAHFSIDGLAFRGNFDAGKRLGPNIGRQGGVRVRSDRARKKTKDFARVLAGASDASSRGDEELAARRIAIARSAVIRTFEGRF
jgi:hypothetical protein